MNKSRAEGNTVFFSFLILGHPVTLFPRGGDNPQLISGSVYVYGPPAYIVYQASPHGPLLPITWIQSPNPLLK